MRAVCRADPGGRVSILKDLALEIVMCSFQHCRSLKFKITAINVYRLCSLLRPGIVNHAQLKTTVSQNIFSSVQNSKTTRVLHAVADETQLNLVG